MKRRTVIPIVLLTVVLAPTLVMLAFYLFSGKDVWHCGVTQPRPSGVQAWEKVIAPAEPLEAGDAGFFQNVTITSDTKNYLVEYAATNAPENPYPYQLHDLQLGERLEIDGGFLECAALGAAWLTTTQTLENNARFHLFGPNLKPLPKARRIKHHNLPTIEHGGNFRNNPGPAIQILLRHQGLDDVQFHGLRVFDARTRKLLSSGHNASGGENDYRFTTHVPLWHRAPIDVVLDITHGPSKTFEFAPRMGAGFSDGAFECRLAAIFEDIDGNSGSSSSSGSGLFTHKYRKAQNGDGSLRLLFLCQPTASGAPLSFEFLDANGKALNGGGGRSGSSYSISISRQNSLKDIARIRALYRTQRRRIVFRLPYIPGLPAENDAVENLFDVYVPYVQLRDQSQLRRFVKDTLLLNSDRTTGTPPPVSIKNATFPLEFHGVTLREIAERLAEGGTLHLDEKNDTVTVEYPVPLGERIGRILRKIF